MTTDDIFSHKNVVAFSLPGAFTPTCSSTHLPRFNELAPVFKAQGIDTLGVCFLHAYANPEHEERMRQVLREEHPDAVVSISSEVLREYRALRATVVAFGANQAIKFSVRRRRPALPDLPPLASTVSRLSYPSAHASTSVPGGESGVLASISTPYLPNRDPLCRPVP